MERIWTSGKVWRVITTRWEKVGIIGVWLPLKGGINLLYILTTALCEPGSQSFTFMFRCHITVFNPPHRLWQMWRRTAKAFPALLQHSQRAVGVAGLPRKAAFSHFVFSIPVVNGQICRGVTKCYCLCVSLCSSSLVWDNDSRLVKCTWIKSSPVIYCWVGGYAGFNVAYCNSELWFNGKIYNLQTSNRDCCRNLLYLCNQAMINYDDAELQKYKMKKWHKLAPLGRTAEASGDSTFSSTHLTENQEDYWEN